MAVCKWLEERSGVEVSDLANFVQAGARDGNESGNMAGDKVAERKYIKAQVMTFLKMAKY